MSEIYLHNMKTKLLFASLLALSAVNAFAQTWIPVGTGTDNPVLTIDSINGDLYIAGAFTYAGGVSANHIARWDGAAWSALGTGLSASAWGIGSLNGKIYAGGDFDMAGGNAANYVAEWDGTSWSPMGSGMSNFTTTQVQAFENYNGLLFISGAFNTANGMTANNIVQWDGTTFSPVGTGMNSVCSSLHAYNGYLYTGGAFQTANGVSASRIAQWDGSNFTPLGSGFGPNSIITTILSICDYNGDIYAGGFFSTARGNPISHIAKWDGTAWAAVDSGLNGPVLTMAVYNGALYAGGTFNMAGSTPVSNIAKWDGSSWSAVDSGMNAVVHSLTIYKGELYAGGGFTTAGGNPINYIAKLSVPSGINERVNNAGTLMVYPNPGNGIFNIKMPDGDAEKTCIKIYNTTGQIIFSLATFEGKQTIDISSYPPGIYFLKAEGHDTKTFIQKLVIQKE